MTKKELKQVEALVKEFNNSLRHSDEKGITFVSNRFDNKKGCFACTINFKMLYSLETPKMMQLLESLKCIYFFGGCPDGTVNLFVQ